MRKELIGFLFVLVLLPSISLSLTESEEFELFKQFKLYKKQQQSDTSMSYELPQEDSNKQININIYNSSDEYGSDFDHSYGSHAITKKSQLPDSFSVFRVSFVPENKGAVQFGKSIGVDGLVEHKLFGKVTLGLGMNYFRRKIVQVDVDFNVLSMYGQLTNYPGYEPGRFSLYYGIKLNYYKMICDGPQLESTKDKPYLNYEPILGLLVPIDDNWFIDCSLTYQNRKYHISIDDYLGEIVDNSLVFDVGIRY